MDICSSRLVSRDGGEAFEAMFDSKPRRGGEDENRSPFSAAVACVGGLGRGARGPGESNKAATLASSLPGLRCGLAAMRSVANARYFASLLQSKPIASSPASAEVAATFCRPAHEIRIPIATMRAEGGECARPER
jgi:hypothetical protein